ncbi:MAG: HEAT repeat domain-containing protein [Anaerolineales bacterium]
MPEIGAVLAELLSGDPARAEPAALALPELGDTALAELRQLLAKGDSDARWWATRALAGFPSDEAGELLVIGLADPDSSVRHCAALALSHRPHLAAITPLLGLLSSQDSLLARLAGNALVAAGGEAVSALLEATRHESTQAKTEAARALALIGDTRAVPALFKLLESESALLEHWASAGLAKMGVGMSFFQT